MPAFNINEAYDLLKPLGILVLEMVVYTVFVFHFYRFLASRDIIKVDFSRYEKAGLKFGRFIIYLFQHVLFFPVIIFFWFAVLAVFLGFLGRHQTPESILLVSIALVSAIRVTSYYSEDLSKDLAKMLPFALLGVYLVDQSYFDFSVSLTLIEGLPNYWRLLVYYFAFIMGLETVLRILHFFATLGKGKPETALHVSGKPRNE